MNVTKSHGISSISNFLVVDGRSSFAINSQGQAANIPRTSYDTKHCLEIVATKTGIILKAGGGCDFSNSYVTLLYTCTNR